MGKSSSSSTGSASLAIGSGKLRRKTSTAGFKEVQAFEMIVVSPQEFDINDRITCDAVVQGKVNAKLLEQELLDAKRRRAVKTARRLGVDVNEIIAPAVMNEHNQSFSQLVTTAFVELKHADLSMIPVILPKRYHTDDVAQEIVAILKELETQLIIHRQKILQEKGDDALHLYDIQWGLDSLQRADMRDMLCLSTYRDKTYIGIKVATAYWKARTCLDVVENMNDQNIGCQLIGLFVLDMLGVDSLRGGCYHNKHNKEFGLKRAVTNEVKYIVFGLLVCCYGFLISVILSYGANKGRNWHYAWLIITLLKCVFDLSVKQMMMSVVVNYGIPNLVKADVNIVRKILEECGLKLLRSKPAFHLNRFSPSDYLFASTYVAKVYPHLIESQLVMMYRCEVPEPILDKHKMTNMENRLIPSEFRNWKHGMESIFLTCITIILWIGALNPGIQKVILNIIPTVFFVSFSFFVMMVSNDLVLVSIVIALLLSVLGPLVIQVIYYRYKMTLLNNNSKTTPASLDRAPLVFDATGKATSTSQVIDDIGLDLQHKRSLFSIVSDADCMITSSESEISNDDTNNDDRSTTNASDNVIERDEVDLIQIQQAINRSQSILAGSVTDATVLRDKLTMADQNVEETRKRQRERAKKRLARRLQTREIVFPGPTTTSTTTSTTTLSTAKNEHDSETMSNNLIKGEDETYKDDEAIEFQSAQFQRQRSSSSGGSGRHISIRHSRSSVLKRRESAKLEHQQMQHLSQLSLQDEDNNNTDDGISSSTVTTSRSPESQFKPAMRNLFQTQRRMSRRGSGLVFDLIQAQNDAALLQEMESADKKAAVKARLDIRLRNRQLFDDIQTSGDDEEDKGVTDSDIDVTSSGSSVDEVVVVNKVVERKKRVNRKQLKNRKTKVTFNRNRRKTNTTRKSLKTTSNSRISTRPTAATKAFPKKNIMAEPLYEDEEDDDENGSDTKGPDYMNESDSDSDC